ncbi:MAG: cyclic pyranopterin monophosphate synthase MoaC [Spirochaetaceae bacterium]|nr:cyclic pyranopterin monophosphate synthase MoaC [Spirochaetaceae bacterium]
MELTHINKKGEALMVDVSKKEETKRIAIATGSISMNKESYIMIKNQSAKKGDVLAIARVAGIMAAKQTSSLIPLCHPLYITKANVDFSFNDEKYIVESIVSIACVGKTGIEMEALTGATVSLLTIYDMLKAVDRTMVISNIKLLKKDGGKSGYYEST